MKQFKSIEKLDEAILYLLELASSLSIILLAFGLTASMANVLTDGSVLSGSVTMQHIWAWTQTVAIDASVAGTVIRTCRAYNEGERLKLWLYGLLSALLLFTAAIVSNIEAVQQTLNTTLESAYMHVHIPVEILIWTRSLAIVLLIVSHALKHVKLSKPQPAVVTPTIVTPVPPPPEEEKEVIVQKSLPLPKTTIRLDSQYESVAQYVKSHGVVSAGQIARDLKISKPTASKWLSKIKESEEINEPV